ncbi:salivary glue protein Sgs-3-like, partial [Pecten maximus]|uniref:salivary glue protein Sgs-3-like n=1 Tax=Pecten maximus TaxID=6579 RepID=UPI001458C2F3
TPSQTRPPTRSTTTPSDTPTTTRSTTTPSQTPATTPTTTPSQTRPPTRSTTTPSQTRSPTQTPYLTALLSLPPVHVDVEPTFVVSEDPASWPALPRRTSTTPPPTKMPTTADPTTTRPPATTRSASTPCDTPATTPTTTPATTAPCDTPATTPTTTPATTTPCDTPATTPTLSRRQKKNRTRQLRKSVSKPKVAKSVSKTKITRSVSIPESEQLLVGGGVQVYDTNINITTDTIVSILKDPITDRVSNIPPVKPKGDLTRILQSNEEDFDDTVQLRTGKWSQLALNYFNNHLQNDIKLHAAKWNIQQFNGLYNPLSGITNNASESIDAVLKTHVKVDKLSSSI